MSKVMLILEAPVWGTLLSMRPPHLFSFLQTWQEHGVSLTREENRRQSWRWMEKETQVLVVSRNSRLASGSWTRAAIPHGDFLFGHLETSPCLTFTKFPASHHPSHFSTDELLSEQPRWLPFLRPFPQDAICPNGASLKSLERVSLNDFLSKQWLQAKLQSQFEGHSFHDVPLCLRAEDFVVEKDRAMWIMHCWVLSIIFK